MVSDPVRHVVLTISTVFFYICGAALFIFVVAISVHAYLHGVAPPPGEIDDDGEGDVEAEGRAAGGAEPREALIAPGSVSSHAPQQQGPRLQTVPTPKLRPPSHKFLERMGITAPFTDGRQRSNSDAAKRAESSRRRDVGARLQTK